MWHSYSSRLPTEGRPGWVDFEYPLTYQCQPVSLQIPKVTHPSTNRARRWSRYRRGVLLPLSEASASIHYTYTMLELTDAATTRRPLRPTAVQFPASFTSIYHQSFRYRGCILVVLPADVLRSNSLCLCKSWGGGSENCLESVGTEAPSGA